MTDLPFEERRYVTAMHAAQYLGLSRTEVYGLIYDDTLSAIKRGSRHLVEVSSVLAYADQLKQEARVS